jgi:tetratricopeptide (TPR) repeat protein/predicted Ser/Thr protein kinase
MSDAHWQRIEEIFHRASSLSAADRVQSILAWCQGDRAMCNEVLALLASDSVVEQLMAADSVVPDGLLRRDPPVASEGADADPWVGRSLGPYFLVRVLGRGGMGVVYLGQRRGDDLAQTVAIKVIARHLRASPAVSQFLAERHALGRLEHEYIARLIAGGVEDGAPYVVMEYVDGRRLDEVCDDPSTPVLTKIALMLQLCEAVSYVHGNLILHRDLKPGNVMVTGAGRVKLLDFGTLKRMDVEAADSLMTRAGMRSVTLRYASPEHLAGRTVSTATDIYSLGVILRRVLSGKLPDFADPAASGAEISAPARLGRDLDAIVSKAMRPEPELRYSSVDALAQDLRNALANRPVAARAGGMRYRAGRFYLRHRTALLGAAAIAITLTIGVLAVMHEGSVARIETARAREGVEDERKLAHLLLFDYFEQLKAIPGSTEAQRKAVSQALAYLDGLVRDEALTALTQDRIDAYTKMGNLLGNPYEENIGDSAGALETLAKAVALARQLLAQNPADLHSLQSSAAAEQSLGRVYFGAGDPQRAVEHLRPAAESSRRIANTVGVDSATIAQAASVVDSLGDVYGQEGAVTLDDPATAITTYETAQSIDALGLRLDAACARCRRGVALEYWKIGMLTEAIDEQHAADLYNDGLDTLAHSSAAEQATTRVRRMDTVLRQRLGTVLLADGRADEGIAMLSDVQRRFLGAVQADPTDARARFDLAALDASLADGFDRLGRESDALAANHEYVDAMNFLVAQDPKNTSWRFHRADALTRVGLTQLKLRDEIAGRKVLDQGLSELTELARSADSDANILSIAASALYDARRDPQLALAFAQRAVAGAKRPSPDALLTLARAQRSMGHADESRASAEAALTVLASHPKSLGNAEQTAQARVLQGS